MLKKIVLILMLTFATEFCFAECSQDHFFIGHNQDGITGTADDNKLFVDCTQKYRHSDPNFYSLNLNMYGSYSVGEPGFDVITSSDPSRQLSGTANVDYRIIIECVAITSGFSARKTTQGFLMEKPGDWFNYSSSDPHLHPEYRAPAETGGTELQWITFVIYDALGTYQESEPFSIAFGAEPMSGDLVIDGKVDINDMTEMAYYWLEQNGDRVNDYYERADANKDGYVNFEDFRLFAENYLE